MTARPSLLLYCQHSLGMGHLTRSFAIAAALTAEFRVVFLNGGPFPPGTTVPAGVEIVNLPPLGMEDGHGLVSRGALSVPEAKDRRRAAVQYRTRDAAVADTREPGPAVAVEREHHTTRPGPFEDGAGRITIGHPRDGGA